MSVKHVDLWKCRNERPLSLHLDHFNLSKKHYLILYFVNENGEKVVRELIAAQVSARLQDVISTVLYNDSAEYARVINRWQEMENE